MTRAKSTDDLSLLLGYGVDPKARRVFLHAGLEHPDSSDKVAGENAVEHVVRSLLYLGSTSTKPIELWINTTGGCIWEMFGILDVMNSLEVPIITVGFGSVCSAGGPILVTGDHKFATAHCRLMVHAGTSNVPDLEPRAAEARLAVEKQMHSKVYDVMGAHTLKPATYWRGVDKRTPETWYSAEQMLELGVIEGIYSPAAVRGLGY